LQELVKVEGEGGIDLALGIADCVNADFAIDDDVSLASGRTSPTEIVGLRVIATDQNVRTASTIEPILARVS
jgi:hypothetical protein